MSECSALPPRCPPLRSVPASCSVPQGVSRCFNSGRSSLRMMRRGFGAVVSGGPGRPVGATGPAVPTVVVIGVTGVAPLRRHDRLRAEPQERGSGLEGLASTTGVYMLPTSACVCAIPPVPPAADGGSAVIGGHHPGEDAGPLVSATPSSAEPPEQGAPSSLRCASTVLSLQPGSSAGLSSCADEARRVAAVHVAPYSRAPQLLADWFSAAGIASRPPRVRHFDASHPAGYSRNRYACCPQGGRLPDGT